MLKSLQKSCNGKDVAEEAWFTDDFIMGIMMDMTAAGVCLIVTLLYRVHLTCLYFYDRVALYKAVCNTFSSI